MSTLERNRAPAKKNKPLLPFRALIENSTDIVTVLDPDGTVRFTSPSGERILGYGPEELVGTNLARYIHPDDQNGFGIFLDELSKTVGESVCAWFHIRHQDGSWRFLEAVGKALTSGGRNWYVVNSRDATERRRAEERLLESQARLAAIVDSAMDAVITVDAGQHISSFNPAAERMFGRTAGEVIGQPLDLIIPERSAQAHRHFVDSFGQSNTSLRSLGHLGILYGRRANGEEFPVEISISQAEVHGNKTFAAIVRDVTERERDKAALEESAKHYRYLFENNPQPMWIYDLESLRFLEVNEAAVRHYGFSHEEFLAMTIRDIRPAQDLPALDDNLAHRAAAIEKSGPWKHRKQDGTLIDVEIVSHSMSFGSRPARLVLASDVTARQRAEEEIRRRADQFAALYETARDVATVQELPKVLRTIVERAAALLNAASGSIFLYDRERKDLQIAVVTGMELSVGTRFQLGEGMAGRVALSHEPLIVDDYRAWEYRSPQMGAIPIASTVAVPMLYGGLLIGVLAVNEVGDDERRFTESDARLLSLFASHAASAVHNARLLEETTQRAREFEALYATTRDLAAQQDLAALLRIVVERAVALLRAPSGSIFLYDAASQELEVAAWQGPEFRAGTRVRLGEGMAGKVAQSRQPLIVDDYRLSEHRWPGLDNPKFSASVDVPMLYGGDLVGVLTVNEIGDTTRRFTDADTRLLSLFAGQAASAVHNARLLEEARRRAEQLAQLYDLGLKLNRVLDPQAQLELLFDGAMKALHADRVEFSRYDEAREELVIEGGRGFAPEMLAAIRGYRLRVGVDDGIISRVGSNRQPLIVPDVLSDPGWRAFDPEIRSGVWVPVEYENRLLGVLGIMGERSNAFTKEDQRMLTLFANQAAVALENGRLFDETNRRLRQIRSLHAIDLAIGGSVDLTFTLNVFLEQALSQLDMDAADILVLDHHTQTLEFAAGRGFRTKALSQTRLRMGEGNAGRAALERRIISIPKLSEGDFQFHRSPLFDQEQFVSYYAVPLRAKGQVKGVLEVFHRSLLDQNREWLDFLETLAGQAAIAIDSATLFDELQRSNIELALAYDTTIEGWSRALDLRDKETEGHTQRVTQLTLHLGRAMGLSETDLQHVRRGALLHDIGKVGIPDSILLKPGPLTEDEWRIMRTHPEHAYHLLSPIAYLRRALDIPYCHHERYNGSGYPRGLKGEEIPLAARIFAVVDVWDALLSNRPYREAWPKERAREHILTGSGAHFDPKVVKAFFDLVDSSP